MKNIGVRKSIPLRTFILYKKSIIFKVRFCCKINYERPLDFTYFYERFNEIIERATHKRGLVRDLFY